MTADVEIHRAAATHQRPSRATEQVLQEERDAVMSGHDEFQKLLRESGELLGFVALADPSNSTAVRVRDGRLSATDGPYVEAEEFLAGYYAVECDAPERAVGLAGVIPTPRSTRSRCAR